MRNIIIISVLIVVFSICYFLSNLIKLKMIKAKYEHELKIKLLEEENKHEKE